MSDLKCYMRSDNFFVVHETENPAEELTVERLIPCIKVDGTFMYVLKTGVVIHTRLVVRTTGGILLKEILEFHILRSNIPFHIPGDTWGFGLAETIEDVAKMLLEFIQKEINKEKK